MCNYPIWFNDYEGIIKQKETAYKRVLNEFSSDFHNNFTPFDLCCEIVDKLDQQKLTEGKWLVVANIEFVYIIKKYFEYKQWDINNIYFVTPCPLKVRVVEKIGISEYNIALYDYKTLDVCGDFEGMKFDVIIGNPPYQDVNGSSTSNSSLWVTFAEQMFNRLEPNGIIGFVTPQSWMKPNHKILKWMKSHSLTQVVTDVAKFFPGVGSTFCYWLAINKKATPTDIVSVDGMNITLASAPYLVPGGNMLSIHQKVVFTSSKKFKIDSDQQTAYTLKLTKKDPNLSKEQTDHCKYPIYHTNAQTIYSAVKTKNFDDKKVMFSDSGYFKPRYDNGELGSSQRCYYILVPDETTGQIVTELLYLKLYQFIVSTAKWSGFSDLTVLRSLPVVDLTKKWTNNDLYQHFNLTQSEIDLIESTIK